MKQLSLPDLLLKAINTLLRVYHHVDVVAQNSSVYSHTHFQIFEKVKIEFLAFSVSLN